MTGAVVFEYTQTGQLAEVVDALIGPLIDSGWRVRRVPVAPANPFPFPWPLTRFFGVFPECADERATVPLAGDGRETRSEPDELVILAYQVWYLAPSLPVRALLTTRADAFAGRDVLTVIACRNMWYSAAAEVRRRLNDAGARHLGTVAATDTRPQAITFVTTLRWLLVGNRDGRLGRAGVGAEELARVRAVGERIATTGSSEELAKVLADTDSAPVEPVIAAADLLAGAMFRRWGSVVRWAADRGTPARTAALAAFVGWLGASIAIGLPSLALARLVAGHRFDAVVTARVVAAIEPRGARE
ncbi:hypothetical protein [Nocardia sp. BMG51109]|uniref:hypothetical protein n=1 Tax=Nocardia sp. BMG51109 TaxID=1056816 RepID=UPI0004667433|nr:hypothetical protein [Nocardia sp. BMG51109]